MFKHTYIYLLLIAVSAAVLLQKTPISYAQNTSTVWETIRGSAADIAVGADGTVAAVDQDGVAYRFNPSEDEWRSIGRSMKAVAVAPDGAIWGVDKNGAVRIYNGTRWRAVGTGAVEITVDDTAAYVVTNTNTLAKYTFSNRSWSAVKGSGMDV